MNKSSIVEKLRELLGPDAVMIPWQTGKKGGPTRWKHLTASHMSQDSHLRKLERGNIGVALGRVSGCLCSIDIDSDELVPAFVTLPIWSATTMSRGMRGCNFWFRFEGDYPTTQILKTIDGKTAGEFRADGSQTIIHGIHPSGNHYTVNTNPVACVKWAELPWPQSVGAPILSVNKPTLLDVGDCTEDTQETEVTKATEDTHDNEVIDVVRGAVVSANIRSIEQAVEFGLPTAVHENNHRLFRLAQALKRLELNRGTLLSPVELMKAFDCWYSKATRFLRPGAARDDYKMEFFNAYRRVKYPLGVVLAGAWKKATSEPYPSEASLFEKNDIKLLVALCYHLQVSNGNQPFYLSCRSFQSLIGHKSHTTSALWLSALEAMQILKTAKQGTRQLAARYYYVRLAGKDVT